MFEADLFFVEALLQLFGNWSSFMGSLASILGDFSPVVCLGQERCLLGAPCWLFLQPLGVLGYFQHFPLRPLRTCGWHRGQDLRPPYPGSSDPWDTHASVAPQIWEFRPVPHAGSPSLDFHRTYLMPGCSIPPGQSRWSWDLLTSLVVRDRHWGRGAGRKAPSQTFTKGALTNPLPALHTHSGWEVNTPHHFSKCPPPRIP